MGSHDDFEHILLITHTESLQQAVDVFVGTDFDPFLNYATVLLANAARQQSSNIQIYHRLQWGILEDLGGIGADFVDKTEDIAFESAFDNAAVITVETYIKAFMIHLFYLWSFIKSFKSSKDRFIKERKIKNTSIEKKHQKSHLQWYNLLNFKIIK